VYTGPGTEKDRDREVLGETKHKRFVSFAFPLSVVPVTATAVSAYGRRRSTVGLISSLSFRFARSIACSAETSHLSATFCCET
jgi:hypothetical protein